MIVRQNSVLNQSEYLLLLSVSLIALGLALFIVFQAYRGYRRSSNRQMLLLASGLGLLTIAPLSLSIAVESAGQLIDLQPQTYTFYVPLAGRLSAVVGLGLVLYSLLIDP